MEALDDLAVALRERLIDSHLTGEGARLSAKMRMAFVVRTWNAYQDGETIKRLVWHPGGATPDRFPCVRGLADRAVAEAA